MSKWPSVNLSELAECLDSRRVPITENERVEGSVPYYGANGQVGWIDRPLFNEPLLLIAEDGGHFDEPSKGVAYVISGPSWVNNHAHVLRAKPDRVILKFLSYYFRHFNFLPYITGSTRQKLNQKELFKVNIPLPPLPEQKRIVRIIDEAEGMKRLRAQTDSRTADLIPALFYEMFGSSPTNSKNFQKQALGDLIKVKSGNGLTSDARESGHYPVYGGNGITGYHSEYMFDEPVVVIGRVGVYCGSVHISMAKSWITDNALYVSEMSSQLDLIYLAWALRFENLNQYAGRAAQPLVSGSRIYPVEIIVPPRRLQIEFADHVRECGEMNHEQAKSDILLNSLFQSILHRSFEGEL